MTQEKQPARLLPRALARVLPPTFLALLGIWFVASEAVTQSVTGALQKALDLEASQVGTAIGLKLSGLVDMATGLAGNDLVFNGLIDFEARSNYLPALFRSLRVPGPAGGRITLVDYRARIVVTNGPEASYLGAPRIDTPWIAEALAGETVIQVSDKGLIVASPVLRAGQAEGAIILEHGRENLIELLHTPSISQIVEVETTAGQSLYVSDLDHLLDEHGEKGHGAFVGVTAEAEVPGFPELRVHVSERGAVAFAALNRLKHYMLVAVVLSILAIAAGIVATAYFTTSPLVRFLEAIRKISADNLDYRMAPADSREFQLLTTSFNGMMENLRDSTMSHDYVDSILNSIGEMLLVTDTDGTIQTANLAALETVGCGLDELAGRHIGSILSIGVETLPGIAEDANAVIETELRCKAGHSIPIQVSVSRLGGKHGRDTRKIYVLTDITERKAVETALRESEARAQAVVETAVDAIVMIDQWGKVQAFNPAGEELFGYRAEEVIGQNVSLLMPTPQREEHDNYLQNYLDTSEAKIIGIGRELTGLRKDGSAFPLELSVSEVWLDQGRVFVGMLRDITERKNFERELESLALYDVLTGLANRSLFQSRLKDALANAKRTGQMVAIMLLDLDHFKDINDSLGHPAGDALLKEVAARLQDNVRETDTVARLGGDEFAVIATNIDHLEGVATVAEKLVGAIAVPFDFEHHEIRTGTSVGISVSPPDVSEPEKLLKHADFALYQAKSAGRGTWQFYDAEMNAKRQARKTLEDHLARALGRDEFILFYQPKIDARTGQVTGVEALIRWMHPEHGIVPPLEFIPIAEESGQIVEIGAWVVRTACAQHLAWREAGLPPVPVAINLSSVQFKDGDLPLSLRAILAEFGLNPGFIELEITETVIVENTVSVSEQFHMLRKLGHSIAIDDFGTGYSSLAYLRQFPVDKLKIDRAFIANITDNPGDAALVKGIIALAKSLGMGTVAEGVETEEQLALLRRHGCEEIQGYYYSPPIPAEAFADWYRARAREAKAS